MLNASHLEIIKTNPIGDDLAPIRDALYSTITDLGITWLVEELQQIEKRGELY